jgi:phosphate transport system substrate-binding protein
MRKKNTAVATLASLLVLLAMPHAALAQALRDYVYVVGSSTVYPFSTIVAERFGRGSRYKTPKVESTGSGGGIKLFCAGIGTGYPDIVNASRRITPSEVDSCTANGVGEIVEVRIGYDGIVLANAIASPLLDITREQLYLALARRVPGEADGELIDNPYTRWNEIEPGLPDLAIEVLGPPPTSGTRDAFAALVLETGCRRYPWIAELEVREPTRFRRICHTLREDGRYIDAGENDNLVVQKLQANPSAFGIIGFSFLDQNAESIQGSVIDGERPDFDNIAVAGYPLSRPLFFYAKKAHVPVIPGLREFLAEFTSERTWGDEGYLSYRGLVPMSVEERRVEASRVAALHTLALARQ